MNKYIVRQPIKDENSHVLGYEIMYFGEHESYGNEASDVSAAETIYGFLTQSTEKALRHSLSFMTFTSSLLIKRTPHLFKKTELVIQIEDSVIVHPLAMHLVQQYAREGYQIAVNDFQFSPRYLGLMEFLTYIKIDFKGMARATIQNIIETAHGMHKKCIATNVDTEELYQMALEMKVEGLQGAFVAGKLSNKTHQSGFLRSNFFRLVIAVTQDEPDVEEVEQIISMDATLTYGILKMANSAYFARRHPTTSIRQGIMTLGLGQLKRWVYLLSAGDTDETTLEDSEEFLKLSFMRANFCSELIQHIHHAPISRADAYLLGMFSTLEYLIDAPLEETLEDIPMTDEMHDALLFHTGVCGALIDLVLCYERADWAHITENADKLGIPTNQLTTLYFSCMEEVNETWEQIARPIEGAEEAAKEAAERAGQPDADD